MEKKIKISDNIESKEELEFLEAIENGQNKTLPKKEFDKEKKKFQKIANNTLKRKSINIRVFESDIDRIKSIALSEGIPYQTLITSVLHKVATGKVVKY